jgi:hypothetical protein
MTSPAWYWLLFIVAAAFCFAVPWLCFHLEERQRRRDRQAWDDWQRGWR